MSARSAGEARSADLLVYEGERSHNGPEPVVLQGVSGCERPSSKMAWLMADGELRALRCGASNKCRYCAKLSAFENALVVRLDALEGASWPTWGLTTTTREPWTKEIAPERAAMLRDAERKLFQQLRREQAREGRRVEYLGFVEFTTPDDDGGRRGHVHHLVKGLGRPDEERAAKLEADVSKMWLRYTDEAWRVECRPLRSPMGSIAYLALHHHKDEQRPPEGWSGKRFRPSRGYFERPVPELRAEARELVADRRIERELVSAWDVPDRFDGGLLDELLMDALPAARERAAFDKPRLVVLDGNGDVSRVRA